MSDIERGLSDYLWMDLGRPSQISKMFASGAKCWPKESAFIASITTLYDNGDFPQCTEYCDLAERATSLAFCSPRMQWWSQITDSLLGEFKHISLLLCIY